MKNFSEFKAWCQFLDVRHAPKQQYIFTTEDEFKKDFEWMIFGTHGEPPLVYGWVDNHNEPYSMPCIGIISFATYEFIFLDPSKIPQPVSETKSING